MYETEGASTVKSCFTKIIHLTKLYSFNQIELQYNFRNFRMMVIYMLKKRKRQTSVGYLVKKIHNFFSAACFSSDFSS
jgi:hypothetical protein